MRFVPVTVFELGKSYRNAMRYARAHSLWVRL
jgi:hypothetical protein